MDPLSLVPDHSREFWTVELWSGNALNFDTVKDTVWNTVRPENGELSEEEPLELIYVELSEFPIIYPRKILEVNGGGLGGWRFLLSVWETVWCFREIWGEGGIYPERPISYIKIGMILIG